MSLVTRMTKVGVTGHQKLNSNAWEWVAATIRDELAELRPPLIAVSSLAIGADQLLARIVLDCGGSVHAVLPFADIERSFSPENVPMYRELLDASSTEVLDTHGTDQDAYLAAGKRVVQLSDVLVAVWDGEPAKGKGGTADVVAYALERKVPLIHVNPQDRTVSRHGLAGPHAPH